MLLVRAKVGTSEIHGLGLIAQEFIPQGTVIWRLVPGFDVLFSEEQVCELPKIAQETIFWHGYFDQALGRHVLLSDDDRFTNHSDAANSRFLGNESVALRDIQPGEEITDDYREYGKKVTFEVKSRP